MHETLIYKHGIGCIGEHIAGNNKLLVMHQFQLLKTGGDCLHEKEKQHVHPRQSAYRDFILRW